MICLNIICSYLFESLVPLPCQEAQDSSRAAEAAKTQLQEAEATCGNGSMWFSFGETRHPGEIPADLMCVCVYIMFQTIWFVVLLDSQEGSSAIAVKLANWEARLQRQRHCEWQRSVAERRRRWGWAEWKMSSDVIIYIRIIRMWWFGQPKFGINPIKTSTGGSQKNWRLQAKLTI